MEEKKLPFTGREKIRFNVPPFTGREYEYVRQAVENQKICGDGEFTKKASRWFEEKTGTAKCLMTTSCTHATELAAILADIKPGDEIIMPSYTFVSTANAFVLRGDRSSDHRKDEGHRAGALRRSSLRNGYDHGYRKASQPSCD